MSTSEAAVGVVPPPGVAAEESGLSILRSDAFADRLHHGMARPTQLGRYLLVGLGAVAVGAGVGLFFGHQVDVALAILLLGAILVVGGILQYRSFQRSQAHWPVKILLHEDGIELLLDNGEIRAAEWSDPKLDLEVHSRPSKRAGGFEVTLLWRMDRRIPPCPLTPEGFEHLRSEVEGRKLKLQEFHQGRPGREVRLYLIGPTAPPKPALDPGAPA